MQKACVYGTNILMTNPELSKAPTERSPFPTQEQWRLLQGGAPELWLSPDKTDLRVMYFGNFPDAYKGADVDTPTKIKKYSELTELSIDGNVVRLPVFMYWEYHGKPCENRTIAVGGKGYDRYSPEQYETRREQLRERNYRLISLDELEDAYIKAEK